MNEVKVLFADLYRLLGLIKGEMKELQKSADELLLTMSWQNMARTAEMVMDQSARIRAYTDTISRLAVTFLESGPYEGQTAGKTPMETMAEEEDK